MMKAVTGNYERTYEDERTYEGTYEELSFHFPYYVIL